MLFGSDESTTLIPISLTLVFFHWTGASAQAAPILSEIQEMKDVAVELRTKETELETIENELASLKNVAEK